MPHNLNVSVVVAKPLKARNDQIPAIHLLLQYGIRASLLLAIYLINTTKQCAKTANKFSGMKFKIISLINSVQSQTHIIQAR